MNLLQRNRNEGENYLTQRNYHELTYGGGHDYWFEAFQSCVTSLSSCPPRTAKRSMEKLQLRSNC